MIDYSGWKRDRLAVTELKLDPRNPRVPQSQRDTDDQRALIALYIEKYAVQNLVKSIAKGGYFPDGSVIVWQKDKENKFVLEGNRRVAALKLILTPEIAPDEYQAKLRKLTVMVNKNLLREVQAVMAPSRELAAPIIIEKHTGTSVMPWSTLMQASYLKELVEAAENAQSVADELGLPLTELQRYLRMDKMYALALSLKLPEDVLTALVDKEVFPVTTLERLYNTPQIRKVIHLEDNFEDITDQETFENVYSQIIIDICRKDIDSRKVNEQDDRERYAKQLRDKAPSVSKPKKAAVSSYINKPKEGLVDKVQTQPTKRKRSIPRSKGIVPTFFAYKLQKGASLRKICDELKKVSVDNFPNTSAISYRIFLEKAIKMFLKIHEIKDIPAATPPTKVMDGRIAVSDAQLGDLLNFLIDKNVSLIPDKSVKRTVNLFRNGSGTVSLATLNTIIHNEEATIYGDDVRKFWPSLEGLFIIMLSSAEKDYGQSQNTP